MYADSGLMFPSYQNFSHEIQLFEDFWNCKFQKSYPSMSNLFQPAMISDYDLGAEGDLFKAPEPIIEEPVGGLDPMAAAISMISCGEDVITSQGLKVADIESIQSEQLSSEVFYECKKDLLEKAAIEAQVSEVIDVRIPVVGTNENQNEGNKSVNDITLHKSESSGCLSSMEWIHESAKKPTFLDFSEVDFGSVYGMRRAFSEGDIKTLGSGRMSIVNTTLEPPLTISNSTNEGRREKLSRYWNKKSRRNFSRKIKYACRKALADSQPRIRGRFAKTEESDTMKRQ